MTDNSDIPDGGDSRDYVPPAAEGGGKGRRSAPAPFTLATQLMELHRFVTDEGGTVYRYNGRYWAECPPAELMSLAFGADNEGKSTSARRTEIANQIAARSFNRALVWGRVADHEVAADNGVVDVHTGQVRPHDPEDYLENVIPFDYEKGTGAPPPAFAGALDMWFDDSVLAIDAVQEFFGYVVLSHARFKKALMLIGPSNTGKTELVWIMQTLAGPAPATCSLSVQHMDDPKMRAVLIGARLNTMTEVTTDAMIADGGFKTLVSIEDPVLIDIKYKRTLQYLPTAKHVIACNTLPIITDRSAGTFNRLLVVPMNNIIAEADQDEGLRARLKAEMPEIFAWAVEGAKRLVAKGGRFTSLGDARVLLSEFLSDQNPAIDFVESCMIPIASEAMLLRGLLAQFSRHTGMKTDTRRLGKMLRAGGYTVRQARVEGEQGKALHGYRMAMSPSHDGPNPVDPPPDPSPY